MLLNVLMLIYITKEGIKGGRKEDERKCQYLRKYSVLVVAYLYILC